YVVVGLCNRVTPIYDARFRLRLSTDLVRTLFTVDTKLDFPEPQLVRIGRARLDRIRNLAVWQRLPLPCNRPLCIDENDSSAATFERSLSEASGCRR
ncbi:MAG TPA: hypothetical protein VMF89_07140, partial [Polyangiales bacterium]|nr:hypothetical protein [Polyangiales bacterium]